MGIKNSFDIVSFTAETKFDGKNDEFLSNINKQWLINLIGSKIGQTDCAFVNYNVAGDADVGIVRSAAVHASLLHHNISCRRY